MYTNVIPSTETPSIHLQLQYAQTNTIPGCNGGTMTVSVFAADCAARTPPLLLLLLTNIPHTLCNSLWVEDGGFREHGMSGMHLISNERHLSKHSTRNPPNPNAKREESEEVQRRNHSTHGPPPPLTPSRCSSSRIPVSQTPDSGLSLPLHFALCLKSIMVIAQHHHTHTERTNGTGPAHLCPLRHDLAQNGFLPAPDVDNRTMMAFIFTIRTTL